MYSRAQHEDIAYLAGSVDVADISSNTRSTTDIVEAEGGDELVLLEEEGEGLSDTSASTEHGDLGLASSRGRELAGVGERAGSRTREHRCGRRGG